MAVFDNSFVDYPEAVHISSGDDGYYPAINRRARVCKTCGREGCDQQVCMTLRNNVIKHRRAPPPRIASMQRVGRTQMKDAVRRGLAVRSRVNQQRRSGGRVTFSGQKKPLQKGQKRAPYPLVGRILLAAQKLAAPLLREIEAEERQQGPLSAYVENVFVQVRAGFDCEADVEQVVVERVGSKFASPS